MFLFAQEILYVLEVYNGEWLRTLNCATVLPSTAKWNLGLNTSVGIGSVYS